MKRAMVRARLSLCQLLVASALLLRALVPAGWMPAPGLAIQVCADGSSGVTAQGFAAEAQRVFDAALAGHEGDRDADRPGKDQPCAFAGLAMAWTGADTPELPEPLLFLMDVVPAAPAYVAIGQGLAAPPPPATGPPLLA